MDVSPLLDGLNNAQREAVAAPRGNYLVLAGAGSGKTRVLVHRIAWLITTENVSPFNILAVTFTNKAAKEMRGRLEQTLGMNTGGMWVGTFHGLAHRLLRAHWQEAGLPQEFQILDSDDQLRIVKRLIKELNIDDAQWPPRQVQWFINGKKDEGVRAATMQVPHDPFTRTMHQVYVAYEQMCQRSGLVDFAELLLRAFELWQKNPAVLEHYQQRFQEILVDEFQDTNTIQYTWLRLLAGTQNHMMAVGDDDQSIYGWRGAKIENIQRLGKDFNQVGTIRLEQNYRSTGNILKAANAVIAKNNDRLGKSLWTDSSNGEPIYLYEAFNERDEARFIVDKISTYNRQDMARRDMAILYRSNAQSRVLEEALMQQGIPYRVYGGMRFFERAEIKDALSYLRLVNNRDSDAAFERIVNLPTRGIGARTIETLRAMARDRQQSLWQSSVNAMAENILPARAASALAAFLQLIDQIDSETQLVSLAEQMEMAERMSGLLAHYQKDRSEKGQGKIENLEELIGAAREYIKPEEDESLSSLASFLAHAALEAGEGQSDPYEDCVQLMTLHSAKGLEFPVVFLCGVEEGLFPHQMSAEDPARIAEERRLCYVGITRARQRLFMSYAERRFLHGREMFHHASRFIKDLPDEVTEHIRLNVKVSRPVHKRQMATSMQSAPIEDTGLQMGQRVKHVKFGEGTVLNYEGSGTHARIQVKFGRGTGTKWLVLAYANLSPA
ncbi:MAG: DNA helicase [marine bacterium B5-7]|nr:MAG: DNA helicase [marine bacterium B5-7]